MKKTLFIILAGANIASCNSSATKNTDSTTHSSTMAQTFGSGM